jgi:spore germination protein GerM
VRRAIETMPPARGSRIRAALKTLFVGPSAAERRAGITTAIPSGTRVRSLSFAGKGGSGAVLDVAGLPPVATTSALVKVQVITQVARTLIGLSGIQRIWLRSNNTPWDLLDHQGNVVNRPIDYRALLGFYGVGGFTALP